jgi:hypothetical protein
MIKVNQFLAQQSNLYNQLEESNLELERIFRTKLKVGIVKLGSRS